MCLYEYESHTRGENTRKCKETKNNKRRGGKCVEKENVFCNEKENCEDEIRN